MSDDIDDFEDESTDSNPNLVKDLRKQLKAAKKEAEEATAFRAEYEAGKRKEALGEILKGLGLNPALQKFYDKDRDVSPEEATEWAKENAELFGLDINDVIPDETVTNATAISQVTANAPQVRPGSEAEILQKLKTLPREQLNEFYASLGVREGSRHH